MKTKQLSIPKQLQIWSILERALEKHFLNNPRWKSNKWLKQLPLKLEGCIAAKNLARESRSLKSVSIQVTNFASWNKHLVSKLWMNQSCCVKCSSPRKLVYLKVKILGSLGIFSIDKVISLRFLRHQLCNRRASFQSSVCWT